MDPQIELNEEEDKELRQGQKLYEMDKENPGWQIVKEWLNSLAYHSWVDPRDVASKEEWQWRELNAFHAANNAKELLELVQKAISQGEYLQKVKSGELKRKRMVI